MRKNGTIVLLSLEKVRDILRGFENMADRQTAR